MAIQLAHKMLIRLRAEPDNSEHPIALLGWSDCGQKIFAAADGQAQQPATECVFMTEEVSVLPDSDFEIVPLTADDVLSLADFDASVVSAKVDRPGSKSTSFVFLPSREIYELSIRRITEDLRLQQGDRRVPRVWGARIATGDGEAPSYAFWMHNLTESALCFLRFEAPTPDHASALLKAAADEAAWWGLPRLIAWDMDAALFRRAFPDVRPIERSFHVPMMLCVACSSASACAR